jgi:hypothetical protein
MDELTLLSRLREDLPPARDEVLAQARGRLLERAAERKPVAGPRPRRRRRLALGLAVVAVAAGLVVAGPVGLDVLAPDGRSLGATAEAASLLGRAAINARDPVVGPTQYLKVTSRGVHLGIGQLADGRDVRYYASDLSELWIPAEPSRPWVLRRTTQPYRFLSAEDERALRAEGQVPRSVELLRATDGAFYGPVQGSWQTPTRQFLAPGCRATPTGCCGASTGTPRVRVPPSTAKRWCTSPTCSAPGSFPPIYGPPCSGRRPTSPGWMWSRRRRISTGARVWRWAATSGRTASARRSSSTRTPAR